MTIQEAIIAYLEDTEAVANLFGKRLYAVEAPDDTALPLLVYQVGPSQFDHTYTGAGKVHSRRFSITSYAKHYADAWAAADTVRDALDGTAGTLSAITGVVILLEDESDAPVITIGNEEALAYGVMQSYDVQYEE